MKKENNDITVKAYELAKKQREISVASFFEKNRHLLGFDNKKKALMTTIKEAQEEVSQYDKKYGWEDDGAEYIAIHMSEELGEISRRILRHGGYKKERFDKKELAEEITDLLYLTLKLANKFGIDVEGEWNGDMWKRYEKKVSRSKIAK